MSVTNYDDTKAPACQSESCGYIFWQNASPTVAAIITREDGKVLMTVRDIEPDAGKLDLPGGFLHEDELPEDGLAREIREELGVEIGEIQFICHTIDTYGDNDYYVLGSTFEAKITAGTPTPKTEIAAIEWKDPQFIDREQLAFTNNEKVLDIWMSRQR